MYQKSDNRFTGKWNKEKFQFTQADEFLKECVELCAKIFQNNPENSNKMNNFLQDNMITDLLIRQQGLMLTSKDTCLHYASTTIFQSPQEGPSEGGGSGGGGVNLTAT